MGCGIHYAKESGPHKSLESPLQNDKKSNGNELPEIPRGEFENTELWFSKRVRE